MMTRSRPFAWVRISWFSRATARVIPPPSSRGRGWEDGVESKPVDADVQLRGSNLRFGVKKTGAAATYY